MSLKKLFYARQLMKMSVQDMAEHINAIRVKDESYADRLVELIIILTALKQIEPKI